MLVWQPRLILPSFLRGVIEENNGYLPKTLNTVRSATDSLLCPGPDLPSDYKPPLMKLQVIIRRYFNKTRTQHFKCRLQETFKFITGLYQPFTQGL